MTVKGRDSFYQPEDNQMFDSKVVEQIHERRENRVLCVQQKVSSEFDLFKRFARSFWQVQNFEDVVLGRFTFPFALLNQNIAESKLPRSLRSVTINGLDDGRVVLSIDHVRRGKILLTLGIKDVVFADKTLRFDAVLHSAEMPNGSWLAKKMLALTYKMGRFALNRMCRNLKFMTVIPGLEKNEYTIDFSRSVTAILRDHDIDMNMVHLRSWRISKEQLALQASVNATSLAAYLKKRMPSLFD